MEQQRIPATRHRHGPSPRRRTAALWLIGALVLVYSGVIAATGGIDLTVGGLRIRSRTWQRPAGLGLACLAVVAVADRRRAIAVSRQLGIAAAHALDRLWLGVPPAGVAIVATAWALGAGLVFGTNTAGGADSSGYLNQAKLLARGQVVDQSRLREPVPGVAGAFRLAPLGYRPAPDGERLAPTYPPGYPLLMAPAFLISERAPFFVVPLCGALAVWLTFAIGRRLGETGAGAAAAVLTSVSPTFLYQLVQPMGDVPVTAAWLLALYLATGRTDLSAAAAGLAAGVAVLIRPNLLPLAVLVWAACAVADPARWRWRRAALSIATAIPAVVALGAIQSVRFGSPLLSGYGPTSDLFAWANIGPNLDRYPRWMIETHTPAIALFLLAPVWIVRTGRESRPLFWLVWLFAIAVTLAYLPYVYFQLFEWTYTRFLLPAIPLMWLLSVAPFARWLRRTRPAVGAALAAPVLVGLVIISIVAARNRYAFELHEGERKYTAASDYVGQVLPPNAVAVSMQHSGSVWFYARVPIVRWDHVDPRRLDETLATFANHGYAPFLVVDREEFDRMKERFGPAAQRSLERARPMAQFGDAMIYAVDY